MFPFDSFSCQVVLSPRPASMLNITRPEADRAEILNQPLSTSTIDLPTHFIPPRCIMKPDPAFDAALERYMDRIQDPAIEMDLSHFMKLPEPRTPSPIPMADTRKRLPPMGTPQSLQSPTPTPSSNVKRAKTADDANITCQHCFQSFLAITGFEADPLKSGPWNWHEFVDMKGQMRCPRFWYMELERCNKNSIEAQKEVLRQEHEQLRQQQQLRERRHRNPENP